MIEKNLPIIQISELYFKYKSNSRYILDGITLDITEGAITGITGPSGCGKSTLALVLSGIIPHGIKGFLTGLVTIRETNMQAMSLPQIAGHVGIVLQDPDNQLFMPTVAEEIAFAAENFCCSQTEIHDTVDTILRQLDIYQLRDIEPSKLSGGEKKLVAMAAILSMKPRVLILDEPYSGLDIDNKSRLSRLIDNLKQSGKTVVIIEHDPYILMKTDTLYVMCDGKVHKRLEGAGIHEFLQGGSRELLLP